MQPSESEARVRAELAELAEEEGRARTAHAKQVSQLRDEQAAETRALCALDTEIAAREKQQQAFHDLD